MAASSIWAIHSARRLQLTDLFIRQIGELRNVTSPVLDVHPIVVIEYSAHLLQIRHFQPHAKLPRGLLAEQYTRNLGLTPGDAELRPHPLACAGRQNRTTRPIPPSCRYNQVSPAVGSSSSFVPNPGRSVKLVVLARASFRAGPLFARRNAGLTFT